MYHFERAILAGLVLLSAAPAHADWDEIKQRGSLRVLAVVVAEEPEFFSLTPGQAPGFDHELLRGFAAKHDLKLEVIRLDGWDQLIPALIQGKGDLIAGRFTETEARRRAIAFSVAVFPTRNVVVTRKPAPVVTDLQQLHGLKIGLVKGTSMIESLTAAGVPPAAIDATIASGGISAAFKSGRITATVDEVAGAILAQRKDAGVQMGMFLGPPGAYAYGVRKGDIELLSKLNERLGLLRQSQGWNFLVVKYFGDSALDILKKARIE